MGNCCNSNPSFQRIKPSAVLDSDTNVLSDPAVVRKWMSESEADKMFVRLEDNVPFEKNPRWSLLYKLPQSAYYYDEKARKKNPIPVLEDLAMAMESSFNCNVFTIWCNLFEDGNDYIEWHQNQYGYDCFTLSLGVTRKYHMRSKKNKKNKKTYNLSNGDVFFVSQDADRKNEHSLPKDKKSQMGMRISILFFVDFPNSKQHGWRYNPQTIDYISVK